MRITLLVFLLFISFELHALHRDYLSFTLDAQGEWNSDENEKCKKPVYLDYDFSIYDSFLEEQLIFLKEHPDCKCYWPEYSNEARKLNDFAYQLFSDFFIETALSQLIDDESQIYLLNNGSRISNLHELCISCVVHSFWFSHYYRICYGLLNFSDELCSKKLISMDDLEKISSRIEEILRRLAEEFYPFYFVCLEKHPTKEIEQEINFLQGLYPDLLNQSEISDIKNATSNEIIITDKDDHQTNFFAEYYLWQGLYFNGILRYQQAIELFDKSLQFDDKNKLTYLAKAYANFELKEFDKAFDDYNKALECVTVTPPLLHTYKLESSFNEFVSTEFAKGFIYGGVEGANQGAKKFVPSILYSITGIGQGLWQFSKNPIKISQEFIYDINLFILLARQYLDSSKLEQMIPEMREMFKNWLRLEDFEKGRQLGFVIGKYGFDILAINNCVKAFRETKYAYGGLSLEACKNNAERNAIIKEALKRAQFRQTLFKNKKIKIHWDKQNKHIPGSHNFKINSSTILISKEKLEKLCAQKAGTGEAVIGKMGKAGYKERIDFGEYIGDYYYKINGIVVEKLPTTNGILRYDAKGYFHVVPSHPNTKK